MDAENKIRQVVREELANPQAALRQEFPDAFRLAEKQLPDEAAGGGSWTFRVRMRGIKRFLYANSQANGFSFVWDSGGWRPTTRL